MSSLLTDLSVKCELQAMDILALRKQIFELDDENAELRELVRDLRLQLSGAYDSKELVEYDERLKELGIEVEP